MSDLQAPAYIVTCRGISKDHSAMRNKELYGLGGGKIINSLFGMYGCNNKEIKERADVLIFLVTIESKRRRRRGKKEIANLLFILLCLKKQIEMN